MFGRLYTYISARKAKYFLPPLNFSSACKVCRICLLKKNTENPLVYKVDYLYFGNCSKTAWWLPDKLLAMQHLCLIKKLTWQTTVSKNDFCWGLQSCKMVKFLNRIMNLENWYNCLKRLCVSDHSTAEPIWIKFKAQV